MEPENESRTDRARRLRRDQTRVESQLWQALRNRQLPIDRYFADFACVEAKLVIELDGGQHHAAEAYDAARTEVIEHAGYRVLRFRNIEVVESLPDVLRIILQALRTARP
jgi:very-short-patch-repair endonuclease